MIKVYDHGRFAGEDGTANAAADVNAQMDVNAEALPPLASIPDLSPDCPRSQRLTFDR